MKVDYIYMKMKLKKNICNNNFHEKCLCTRNNKRFNFESKKEPCPFYT